MMKNSADFVRALQTMLEPRIGTKAAATTVMLAQRNAAGEVVDVVDANGKSLDLTDARTRGAGVVSLQRVGALSTPGSVGATAGGYIIDTQRTAQGAFVGVRLVYANYDTTGPMAINKASVAVTPTVDKLAGQGAYASILCYSGGPDGSGLAWTNVTFNDGSATASVPAAVAGSGGTGNGIHLQPGILISDFVAITSVARADGSPLPMLRTRTHVNENTILPTIASTAVQGLNAIQNEEMTGGHLILSGKIADTVANTLTRSLGPFYFGGEILPVGAIFYGSQQTRTLAAFGDSLTQGGNSNGLFGWPTRLHAKYGRPANGISISAANWGVSGQMLPNSLSICRKYCAQHKPHYAALFAWSPNNAIGGSQAVMDALWADVLRTIDHIQQLGITPVVLTSGPVNTMNAADAVLWRAQNARVMALPSSVVKVDVGRALTEPGTYDSNAPKLAVAYASAVDGVTYIDGTHYNNAGYEMMADMVYAAIK